MTPRVVVFTYAGFAGKLLELLDELGSEVVALVIPSNRPTAATDRARTAAERAGIDVLVQPGATEIDRWLPSLQGRGVDAILVWSYSMILPQALIDIPVRACVNVHGGLLPGYRGGHVMQWAIVNGEQETGVTLHYIDAGIDTGPVIAEQRFPIEETDDAATVSAKLRDAGFEVLRKHWRSVIAGESVARPQPEGGRYWPLRGPADNVIDWSAPAGAVRDLVRALVAPWPGAVTSIGSETVIVDRADALPEPHEMAPGSVIRLGDDALVVAAGAGAVAIRAARMGGREISFAELELAPGDRLGAGYPGPDAP